MCPHPMEGYAVASSHGIVIGMVQKQHVGHLHIPEYTVNESDIDGEQRRLQEAVCAALRELDLEYEYLLQLKQQEPVLILDAHRMLLKDPDFIGLPQDLIAHERLNAEWALKRHIDQLVMTFEGMHDSYLRSKRLDIEQVGERLLRHLLEMPVQTSVPLHVQSLVVLAHEMSLSDMIALWRSGVAGIICEQGGLNAHATVMARGMGLPALMGVDLDWSQVEDGMPVILDAERGYWKMCPSDEEQRAYRKFKEAFEVTQQNLMCFASKASVSQDGAKLPLYANIDCEDELSAALRVGVEGIGLCRTEFVFLHHRDEPTEDEQYQYYLHIMQRASGLEVTFRLLDVGGDKPALFQTIAGHSYQADNPNLGLRGVRLLLQAPQALETQLRALLRASQFGRMRILVPMVTQCEEMQRVRAVMMRCCDDLGIQPVALGCMVEIPAAVMIADEMACVSDFFAIGSNDLTQYTFAADRGDEAVARYYQDGHPVILNMIERVVRAGHAQGLSVCVCGELAANGACTQAFLDMGMDALSMSVHSVLPIRRHLSRLKRCEDMVSLA